MNFTSKTYKVSPEELGCRLDQFLSLKQERLTRSQIQKLIQKKYVLINNSPKKASYKLQENDIVLLSFPEKQTSLSLKPLDLNLDILFEDNHLLVINKPSGLVVHPAHGHEQDTLVNALIHHSPHFSMGLNEQRPGIVHRLDKDTSGVLVVAKDHNTQIQLSEQFKNKTVHRVYWALCHGPFYINNKDPRHIYKESSSTSHLSISSFLARHPNDRKKFASQPLTNSDSQKGKFATTHFHLKETLPSGLCLFHCQLETGRTHQIRIHISEMGCPIIGDPLYGKRKLSKTYGLKKLNRLGLHAAELGFVHPHTKKTLLFKTPAPKELKPLFDKFKIHQENLK